jgi:hypothetical protein
MTELAQRPIQDFCCQSNECPDQGKRGIGNLCFRGRGGKDDQIRMILCKTCGKLFSERKGTAFSRCCLPFQKALDVLRHIREGCGTRATSRLLDVHRDSVTRLARIAGSHAKSLHEELVAFSPCDR